MKEFLKKNLRYIFAFLGISILCIIITLLRYYFGHVNFILAITDGFSLSGLLFLCFTGLTYASSEGAFDGMIYATKQMWYLLKKTGKKYPYTYSEYKAMAHTKEYHFSHMLINAILFLTVGIILMIVYRGNWE